MDISLILEISQDTIHVREQPVAITFPKKRAITAIQTDVRIRTRTLTQKCARQDATATTIL